MICSIEGCGLPVVARGWCRRHYGFWRRNGDPLARGVRNPFTDPILRFRSKYRADPETGCWVWTAALHKDRYGWFGPGGRAKVVLAHRWSYEHFVGEIPDGLYVLHRCDEPSCVNPEHLFVGTQADNVADCARKGRRNQVRYRRLTAEQREEIRALYATGEYTLAALGRMFDVHYNSIRRHVQRELFPEGV